MAKMVIRKGSPKDGNRRKVPLGKSSPYWNIIAQSDSRSPKALLKIEIQGTQYLEIRRFKVSN